MIQLIALKNDIGIEIREKFSVIQKRCESSLKKLSQICEEVVMISTCNRTEIYFNSSYDDLSIIEKIFETLNWDKSLMKYICHHKEEKAVRHLMDVVCGFDSLILGEDQILAQVKEAYETARTAKTVHKELQKLFLTAITCGKEFRTKSNLYKIPVSSSSIAVSESRKKAMNRFMILGFGEVGKLTAKYIMSGNFEVLYIAVRDISMVNIEDSRVKVIPFEKRLKYYEDVNCIISCTSAPHTVIKKDDLPNNRNMLLFDLAVPRDLDRDVCDLKNVQVYDIDTVSLMDDNNRKLRKDIMKENRLILEKYIKEFEQWQSLQSISQEIVKLKQAGERVYKERYKTFRNKKDTKDTDKLAEVLLKSTSDAFINKAIEVLKEEQLKGRVSDCMKIIQRIFYVVE
ncbi:glutamyl-tRNA reductase [Clostridium sp. A1-XYC3]|uniref:Glutamyl-tRNA reductase n=1 Tax=Clostridium tanneri TaxID=3037988 RepID=A0ABU4JUN5_9CLOT|nr:glutamyl-tRNA reductase [Clostridium sp. A1-XYC3]MDW8801850.1 glutamyl-tRNA reductase [Clostridium sp. A1-XYC3]